VPPYLVVIVTDAQYFRNLTGNVLMFMPVQLTPRDLERMDGTNERIAVPDYERAVRIYRELIVNAAGRRPRPRLGCPIPEIYQH
jgi:acetylornithine deacetylase/succinyl-diaminopimelate desuccinylase-like protein